MEKFGANIGRKNSAEFLRDPLAASQNIAPRLRDDAKECAIPFSIQTLFAKQKANNKTKTVKAVALTVFSFIFAVRQIHHSSYAKRISYLPEGQMHHLKTRSVFTSFSS